MEGSDHIPSGMGLVAGSLVRIPVPWVAGCTEVPHAKIPGKKEGHKCWCSGLAAGKGLKAQGERGNGALGSHSEGIWFSVLAHRRT